VGRSKFETVDEYVAAMDPAIQPRLNEIRDLIKSVAPGVEERISYNIPGFRLNGRYLIYINAAKSHIGLYPATEVMRNHFGDRLEPLITGKATISLKNAQPLPLDLIRDIVAFQIAAIGKKAK
jgi:uncharacterized protein YdhG (YjbR/CyaY superfamily)